MPYPYKASKMNHSFHHFGSVLLLLALSVLAIACEKESNSLQLTVDEAFQPYFEAFEAAGAARGLSIDLNSEDIGAVFTDDLEVQTAGKCTSFSSGARIIYINQRTWNFRTEMEKEFLIFHELGHCYLDRVHLDEADDNGFCVSIMQSGMGDCTGRYTVVNRAGLLDELFE